MRFQSALFALLCAAVVPAGRADTVHFTETTYSSGFVNNVEYDGLLLTITATYDTADVFTFSALHVVHAPLSYDIPGFGSFTDTGFPDYVVANGVGIGVGSQTHLDLLDSASLNFTGFDLVTSLGPLQGSGISPPPGHLHHSGAKADTTLGLFELDSTGPVTITFTVDAPPSDPPAPDDSAPEPSSVALTVTGLAGLGMAALRKRGHYRAPAK